MIGLRSEDESMGSDLKFKVDHFEISNLGQTYFSSKVTGWYYSIEV
jgi:hypothetical protein